MKIHLTLLEISRMIFKFAVFSGIVLACLPSELQGLMAACCSSSLSNTSGK